MSCLKLYWPRTTHSPLSVYWPVDVDASDADSTDGDNAEPVILSIGDFSRSSDSRRVDELLSRARILRQNQCCPECGRASVEPVESRESALVSSQMPVPGLGLLAGFRCNVCTHEWDS